MEKTVDRLGGASGKERPSAPRAASPAAGRNAFSPMLELQSEAGNQAVQAILLRSAATGTEAKPPAPEPAPEATASEATPASSLIAHDEAETVGPGQMKKSEFLAALRPEVCAAAEAGLAGTEHSAQGCPFIDFWFNFYERQSVERMNRDLPRFAGEGPAPATAADYIPLIAARVRASVAVWAETGEITGLPAGIPLPGMNLPGIAGIAAGALGVLFKARPGGAKDPGNPHAVRQQLGDGRSLDGTVRSRMESAFGRSFSHVRVHTDSGAAGLSDRFNAKAFTVGEHVAFGPGEYQPGSLVGDALIAHELAHVAQQSGGAATAAASSEMLERDADLAGAGAVASLWGGLRSRPAAQLRSGLRLQRCTKGKKKATTPPVTAGSSQSFQPTPVKLDALQQGGGNFGVDSTTLGFTQVNGPASKLQCRPDFKRGSTPGTCTMTPRPIHLALTAVYVKEGYYSDPKNRRQETSNCGAVPFEFQISDTTAELAKQGEQEHVDDIRLAYERTLVPCHAALQALAGTTFMGTNEAECSKDLNQKLGFDPAVCSTREFWKLANSTGTRDVKGWHAFKPFRRSESCEKLVVDFRRDPRNRIPERIASAQVVPAASGCSSPAGPPAASPPTNPPAPPKKPGT